MPQYMQLMMSAPAEYSGVATALQSLAAEIRGAGREFGGATQQLQTEWQGQDARSQESRAKKVNNGVDLMSAAIGNAVTALEAGAGQLGAAVTELRSVVESAFDFGTLVLPNGVAIVGPEQWGQIVAAGPAAGAVEAAYQAIAEAYTGIIEASVVAATGMDEEVSIELRGIQLRLESALPFDSTSEHGAYFNYQGQTDQANARGEIGNHLNEAWCELHGETPLATELRVNPSATNSEEYMKVDRITVDADGNLIPYEVKTGGARPTPAQQNLLPRLGGDGTVHPYVPDTPAARAAGLPNTTLDGTQQIGPVRVQRWDVDSMPDSARVALRQHSVADVLGGSAGSGPGQALRDWMHGPGAYQLTTV
ncbi:MAG TPA: hypothetical protein VGN37_07050 [Actinocatenispora sp.]